MARPLLPVLACRWLAASALHAGREAPPFPEQRLGELAARQDAAFHGEDPARGGAALYGGGSPRPKNFRTFWGCDKKAFRMAQPAHTGTCTVMHAVRLSLEEAGIECMHEGRSLKNLGQDHDHNALAQSVIDDVGWSTFNSTVSWVIAKDPWSRIVSAASWMHGFNLSSAPEVQIRDFRKFVKENLPAGEKPSGIHPFNYLHSISEFAYAVPPGKSQEEQVLTYVGKITDLSRSFKHVCSLLGIEERHCVDPNDARVPQHWVTHGGTAGDTKDSRASHGDTPGKQAWEGRGTRPSTAEMFDDELRERVAQIWAKDIERFGFVFGEL